MAKRQSLEETAERSRFVRNIRNNTFLSVSIIAVVIFLGGAVAGFPKTGMFFALDSIFSFLPFALLFSWLYERGQSKRRLATIVETKRLQQVKNDEDARILADEVDRVRRAKEVEEERQRALLVAEQKRTDDREYLLKKLSITNTYIDIYDSADPERSTRVRQGIAKDLSEILMKYKRAYLTEMLAEPDVNGMVNALGERLKEKGISSAEATQILAARPGEGTSR